MTCCPKVSADPLIFIDGASIAGSSKRRTEVK